jgi:uncharacterized membrane protein
VNKVKEYCKKVFQYIFIEGLTGMASGIFPTIVIGLIIGQVGSLIGGQIGNTLIIIGKVCSCFTGAGIGIGVAVRFKASPYVIISSAICGMIGAYASSFLNGTLFLDGKIILSGAGEPLGAFIAAIVGVTIGKCITGKTKVDIIIVPAVTIITGATVGLLAGPTISNFMIILGNIINWSVDKQPILMGILVSVIMGMVLTMPISSAALSIILNLSGLAAGAATVGCCCNMIGFAVASFKENKVSGLVSQGIGTSKLQMANVMKKPVIWLPAIIASAILGPISTSVFHMTNVATGAGMGTSGLVGQIMTWQTMSGAENPWILALKIILLHFILPGLIAWGVSKILRKKKIIIDGDMKLML